MPLQQSKVTRLTTEPVLQEVSEKIGDFKVNKPE